MGGTHSKAEAINNAGQIVGSAGIADTDRSHAFLYENGVMTDLGTIPLDCRLPGSVAFDINDAGQIVGQACESSPRAFLWSGGMMVDLLTVDENTTCSARGINAAGEVVGFCVHWDPILMDDDFWWGFLYSDTLGHRVTALAEAHLAEAHKINDNGKVVGYVEYYIGPDTLLRGKPPLPDHGARPHGTYIRHAALVSFNPFSVIDLFYDEPCCSYALGINNADKVVGYGPRDGSHYEGFLYSGGSITYLGSLAYPKSINNHDQIVGYSADYSHALLYDGGATIDLNNHIPDNPEWDLNRANDINDAGQIVGEGTIAGRSRGFLLTPLPTAADDAYATGSQVPLSVPAPGVLANDINAGTGWMVAELVASVSHGTVVLGLDGGFVYTPTAGYVGPDTFTYRSRNVHAASELATVTITVSPTAFGKALPAKGATVQPLNVMLTWQASGGATSYRYCLDTTNDNGCDTAWTSVGTALSAPVSGLAALTTYYWQVEAQNAIGPTSANGGEWWAFTTDSPPAVFNKLLPANGATAQPLSVTLTWQASGGATNYRYCRDTTNNNSCDGTWISVGTALSTSVSGLAALTTYYWQVEAQNAIGSTPANSGGWWAFTTTAPPPSTVDDAFATNFDTMLVVAAPGVLTNDNSNGGGALAASLVSTVSHGTLNLAATGGFTYTPNVGFFGTDTFTYRATSSAGQGNVATVTITVNQPTAVQPATDLYAASIVGNVVTLRWKQPVVGPAPSGYVIEGGLNPSEVLASLPTGSSYPIVTFVAPTGAFYVRAHAIRGTERSGASNEIRLFVNVPQPPSAPTSLLGMVSGSSLRLTWRNTYEGGTASSMFLDISGAVTGSLPLALAESFTVNDIPVGTYSLSVRATNASGSSDASNVVTVTVPNACSGPPLTPANFIAYRVGNTISAAWDPAGSGAAPASFVVTSTGSFSASIPTTSRTLSATAPSGRYALSVIAINECGSSAPTAAQIVIVP